MARARKPPAFQMYTKEWLSSYSVRSLSLAGRGLYMDMLVRQWEDGQIPDDPSKVARAIGCERAEVESVWDEVRAEFEVLAPGWISNRRLAEQRAEYDAFCKQRKRASRIGVAARTQRKPKEDNDKDREPRGTPRDVPSGLPLQSASALKIKNTDLEPTTSLEESAGNGQPAEQNPLLEASEAIRTLMAEKRELPPRSTSMPSYEGTEQFAIAMRFLLRYFPPKSPGAGPPREVIDWMGRISEQDAALAVHEMQHAVYPAKKGTKGDRAWRDFTFAEQKRIITNTFNGMARNRPRALTLTHGGT